MSVKVLVIYINIYKKKNFSASYYGLISNVSSNMLLFSFLKDLRKTLSVIKIEKEDIETALNDCRRELQQLEQKNKVHDSKSAAQ